MRYVRNVKGCTGPHYNGIYYKRTGSKSKEYKIDQEKTNKLNKIASERI
jgi:hypothetical protein